MKAINCCGDCGYYDREKYECARGAHTYADKPSSFYADCPLPDVRPVNPRGETRKSILKMKDLRKMDGLPVMVHGTGFDEPFFALVDADRER